MHPKYFVKSVLAYVAHVHLVAGENNAHSVVVLSKPKQHSFRRNARVENGRHLVMREYTAVKKTSVPASPTNK